MALGPVKGHFATAGRCLVQCNEWRERERRGAVTKSGDWFGVWSRYWREGERERGCGRAAVRRNG